MRDVVWRAGFTLMALMGLATLGSNISCGVGNRLVEQALGRTPQAAIARYLHAITEGDRQGALDLWSLDGSPTVDLKARRQSVTDALLAYEPNPKHVVLELEWWSTCCEPGVIDDPDQAGGVRARVAVSSEHKPVMVYRFDLLVPGGYWGDAAGNPVRRWILVDVYPDKEAPLTWPWR
jgi:hypothetical protein